MIPLDHQNNFTFLVAVMLSAQSTDKKVNEITPKLFEIANTAEMMDLLSADEIKNYIREIGLAPTKSKNIKKMSQQLLLLHNGEVPESFEELENLAGVGHKTASVIMSQAFNEPAFPIDTIQSFLSSFSVSRLSFRNSLMSAPAFVLSGRTQTS